jgi:hypothetical protein
MLKNRVLFALAALGVSCSAAVEDTPDYMGVSQIR